MKNIFAGYGKIVKRDLYIHRYSLERDLLKRTVENGEAYGSVSIVGLHKMGKSSLVYNTLTSRAEDYYDKGIIVVSQTMSLSSTPESFFQEIIDKVYEKLEDYENEDIDEKIERRHSKIKDGLDLKNRGSRNIQKFFESVKETGKRIICVIDEFDNSINVFNEYTQGFNLLRELAYQPDTDVTFVFISRRMISDIESKANISPLSNILGTPIYVKGYSEDELDGYSERNKRYEIEVSDEEKTKLYSITGCQPLWMDILMFHYVENNSKDFGTIFDENSKALYDVFENFMRLLDEQKLLNKLYQIIFGPADDYTKYDRDALCDYGIISIVNGEAVVNSQKFYEYLQMKESTVNFYPLWNKTERRLRNLLKKKLKESYGENWEQKMKSKYINQENNPRSLGGFLEKAIELQKEVKKKKDFIQGAPYSMIEALTTAGLFEFFYKEYPLFKDVFGKMEIKKFREIGSQLTSARNRYQHNNEDILTKSFKSKTKSNCERINELIDAFEKKETENI